VRAPDTDFREVVDGLFDIYAHEFCDENNHFQHEALLLRDGRVVQLCLEGDWRGRDRVAEGWQQDGDAQLAPLALLEEEFRADPWFEKMFYFPLSCVFWEAIMGQPDYQELNAQAETADARWLLNWIMNELPSRIAEMYRDSVGASPAIRDPNLLNYRRRKLSLIYNLFLDSALPPFTSSLCSPYEYRCFDLRHNQYDENPDLNELAVLLTDIHT